MPLARRITRNVLARQIDGEIVDVVLLLVSELIANAVRVTAAQHARQGPWDRAATGRAPKPPVITLAVDQVDGALRIEVTDPVLRAPRLRRINQWDEYGRGLHLVANQSRSWGWEVRGREKIVWCEVATTPSGDLPQDTR